jgi:hypothetical protein
LQREMLAFRRAGGEPPRRKRLHESHLSRCSRRSLAIRSNQPELVFILKATTF